MIIELDSIPLGFNVVGLVLVCTRVLNDWLEFNLGKQKWAGWLTGCCCEGPEWLSLASPGEHQFDTSTCPKQCSGGAAGLPAATRQVGACWEGQSCVL